MDQWSPAGDCVHNVTGTTARWLPRRRGASAADLARRRPGRRWPGWRSSSRRPTSTGCSRRRSARRRS